MTCCRRITLPCQTKSSEYFEFNVKPDVKLNASGMLISWSIIIGVHGSLELKTSIVCGFPITSQGLGCSKILCM